MYEIKGKIFDDKNNLIAEILSRRHIKLMMHAEEMRDVLARSQRVLSWIPDSEEVMEYRGLPEEKRKKARDQHKKIDELMRDISVAIAKTRI